MRIRLLFSLLLILLTLRSPIDFAEGARDGRPLAPDFTLPTSATSSGTVSLHDFRGKVVYVDFWASWCVPCRQSFPWMSGMSDRYSAQGLVVVSVNLDKKRDAVDEFLQRFPATFLVALDPSGKTAEAFHVAAMPSSFIVSRTGRIIYTHAGFEQAKAQTIETQIKEALSQ
ncbi:MAG TPA: TlpA disulfide reductase family protein [Thermoanaerobaculia bacterium]|jgi:cytochrome c biogenesis protein CcmG/thiol:disulfide interchange protein DsbE|nr:TlpA disulfide reductase family protein [Thermoanaerobaculia bacterium]